MDPLSNCIHNRSLPSVGVPPQLLGVATGAGGPRGLQSLLEAAAPGAFALLGDALALLAAETETAAAPRPPLVRDESWILPRASMPLVAGEHRRSTVSQFLGIGVSQF